MTWPIPDGEICHCLLDVLREPTFRVIRMTKLENPGISTQQCLQILQDAFGRPSQRGSAFYELLSTFKQKGETASSYLLHLEQVLQCVVVQGALIELEANHVRLRQVQTGARYSLTLFWDLNLGGRKHDPPEFPQLVKEVKEEEEI